MIGVDIPINKLLLLFNEKLWADNTNDYNGRVYINQKDGRVIPEVYNTNDDYKEVLLNDNVDSTIFFDVLNERKFIGNSNCRVEVDIYFSINLKNIYPTINNRATEYAYRDVLDIINLSSFKYKSLTSGFEAFDKFDYDKASIDNMQPYHLFKIKTELTYNINCI